MIIDIIMILKFYLNIYFIDNGGIRIRYPCPNTITLYTTRYTTRSLPVYTHFALRRIYFYYLIIL